MLSAQEEEVGRMKAADKRDRRTAVIRWCKVARVVVAGKAKGEGQRSQAGKGKGGEAEEQIKSERQT